MTQNFSPLPLSLLRLSRNEVDARNLIVQRAQALEIELQDQFCTVTLEPLLAMHMHESTFNSDDWLVQAQWAGAPFDIILPASAAQSWMAARFPELALADMPDCLAAALLETVFEELSCMQLLCSRGQLQIQSLAQNPQSSRSLPQCFALSLSSQSGCIYGQIQTDSLGLMLMAGLLSSLPMQDNRIDVDALPIVLNVEIGRTCLTAKALSELALGDSVLFDHIWIGQDQSLWLGYEDIGVRVRWQDFDLQVIEPLQVTDLRMFLDKESDMNQHNISPISEVGIDLRFDLGQRSILLSDLKAMQVGQTLSLDRPLSASVTIRANGTAIGAGELVEIDGRLGVTVTALFMDEQTESLSSTQLNGTRSGMQSSSELNQAELEDEIDQAFDKALEDEDSEENNVEENRKQ
jgi:type III secretion protein Q